MGLASVPSGASTGRHEAWELRDGDLQRHRGAGCLQAVAYIQGEILDNLRGHELCTQRALDDRLVQLDSTTNKARLGANALLAVSLAFAKAAASEQGLELFAYFHSLLPIALRTTCRLPLPTINLFSGGRHAGRQVALQDVLIVPLPGGTLPDQMAVMAEIYMTAVDFIRDKYDMRHLTADEGGLAPPFTSVQAMLEDAVTCGETAGLVAGRDFQIAIDVAASQFFDRNIYRFDNRLLSATDLIDLYTHWCATYPIYSIEDGLAEDDWTGWQAMYSRLGGRTLVLGDDLLCTNPIRIQQAQTKKAANALLLKVNQIGTVTEALDALQLARQAHWHVVISARSGETEDTWLADLAVGWHADNIKVGSITQSERLAKYNRLLALAAQGLPSV